MELNTVTERLLSHDTTGTYKGLFLRDEQRKWFFQLDFTPGEGTAASVENGRVEMKDLESYRYLVDVNLGSI